MLAGLVEQSDVKDTLDYNGTTNYWVVAESVDDFSCKSTKKVLMRG